MGSSAALAVALLLLAAGEGPWRAAAAPGEANQTRAACNETTSAGVCGPQCVRETQDALLFVRGLLKGRGDKVGPRRAGARARRRAAARCATSLPPAAPAPAWPPLATGRLPLAPWRRDAARRAAAQPRAAPPDPQQPRSSPLPQLDNIDGPCTDKFGRPAPGYCCNPAAVRCCCFDCKMCDRCPYM
jgi:hypothetical protein